MKRTITNGITLLILLINTFHLFSQTQTPKQFDNAINPYINFLKKQKTSAKDYIISCFKEKDIVILCERDHRELTQYDLILDLAKDPYFTKNVGVIYTEVGDKNLNPELNKFLSDSELSGNEAQDKILHFQRNAMSPLWDKSTFAYFLKGIYEVNRNLPHEENIQIFPLDFLGVLENPSPENIIMQYKMQVDRDSLMADSFFKYYEKLKNTSNKRKALIIMNSRHAFKQNITNDKSYYIKNFGQFVLNRYPSTTTSILINNWSQGEGANFFSLMQDGKWDAAFQHLNIEDLGFPINGSPFGGDRLDYGKWMLTNNNFAFQDIFDGFIFYKPIRKFQIGSGVDGLIDDNFYEELINRIKQFNNTFNREIIPIESKEQMMKLSKQVITPMNDVDRLQNEIDKWLGNPIKN